MRFNNLLNHVTPELLQASFFDLKKQAAPGIDGETWAEYAEDFEARIIDLQGRSPGTQHKYITTKGNQCR